MPGSPLDRIFIVCAMLVFIMLTGCRAMDTKDLDGRVYNNEQNRFYIPEKNAKVGFFSHAYRWKSGDMEGFCGQETQKRTTSKNDEQGGNGAVSLPVIIDNIVLSNTTLFPTDSSDLSVKGKLELDKLIKRLNAYEEILRLELSGHTDQRGSIEYNQSLSQRRTDAVKRYINATFLSSSDKEPIEIMSVGKGELLPIADNTSDGGMQLNRRVEARIVASSVRSNNIDPTICHALPGYMSSSKHLKISNPDRKIKQDLGRMAQFTGQPPISVGDQLKIAVAGDDIFNGIYEVGLGGILEIPLLGSVPVHGLPVPAIKKVISDSLIEKNLIRASAISVDTTVNQWAAVEVFVRGAVFSPGRTTINGQKAEDRVFINTRQGGDSARGRLLSVALRQAGGIRPDADLGMIQVIRNGQIIEVDFSGFMEGRLTHDMPLITNDEIVVPSTGYFQGALARPTDLTPPGIRLFMSNPAVPIFNNSSAAIDKDSFSVPYGTRFLRGLISGNCVGGSQLTNASRRGVLVSTNPLTGGTEVIERSIQQMISDPDRDDINPYLMPNDGIACYDSDVTNLRDVAKSFGDVLRPFHDLSEIFSAWK